MGLSVHLLRVECETTATMQLPEFTGSALRGSLLGALREMFCPDRGRADCAPCPLAGVCPISRLIATVDSSGARGEEPPRPYVLRPVQAESRSLAPGRRFEFGLSLIGDAGTAFPYLIQGLRAMGDAGFGLRRQAPGTFGVQRVVAHNPYIAAEQIVYEAGRPAVYAPSLAATQVQVTAWASLAVEGRLAVHLRSPLRLVVNGVLVHRLTMDALVRRLLRRLSDLCLHFGGGPPEIDVPRLLEAAERVRTIEDRTAWLDLQSYSGRTGRRSPIGGLTGTLRFEGDLAPLLPYLGWLPAIGAGKDVTKGNGWIELTA